MTFFTKSLKKLMCEFNMSPTQLRRQKFFTEDCNLVGDRRELHNFAAPLPG